MLVEFPVLVAIAAEPIAAVVMPFIGKAHGDAVLAESPDFFDQAVIELALPFARQKRLDGGAALQKLRAITPAAVGRVRQRDAGRIACIPGVFGETRLLRGGLAGEGRQWQAVHLMSSIIRLWFGISNASRNEDRQTGRRQSVPAWIFGCTARRAVRSRS